MVPKFWGIIGRPMPNSGTKDYPCYRLAKREVSLMVMPGSYAVQSRVYDCMVELESRTPGPVALSPAEIFLQNAQLLVSIENRVAKMEQAHVEAGDSVCAPFLLRGADQQAQSIGRRAGWWQASPARPDRRCCPGRGRGRFCEGSSTIFISLEGQVRRQAPFVRFRVPLGLPACLKPWWLLWHG